MSEPTYDVDYFIAKFEAIPDERWCVYDYRNGPQRCARGHCGQTSFRDTPESTALGELFDNNIGDGPSMVNDGNVEEYQQPTPKARILAALHDIKAKLEAA